MEHYVVILLWDNDAGGDVDILGVAHSIDEAKEIFGKHVKEERQYAEDHLYDIYEDTEVAFEAGDDENYERLYIQGVM